MKKIMIMLAAVACAAMVQAATVSWQVTAGPCMGGAHLQNYVGGNTAAGVYTGTVYLVLASEKANIVEALTEGTSFSSVDSAKTAVAMTGGITSRSVTSDALTTDTTGFMILLVDKDGDGNTVYKFSSEMMVAPSGDPKTPAQMSFAAGTDFAGSWNKVESGTTGDVPEPTSGLLLLLGAAGLALRRKKA